MSEYVSYQHVEYLNHDNAEVKGLLVGHVYVEPKIDGTNAVMGIEDGKIWYGKRTCRMGEGDDNAGFKKMCMGDKRYEGFFAKHPDLVLYGEWLVKHTIKDYVPEAWNRFYVFDVYDSVADTNLSPDDYIAMLTEFNIDHVPVMAVLDNPAMDDITQYVESNHYLLPDNVIGEGIVVKNYGYHNPYGRQTWGKIVRAEFKAEAHNKPVGAYTHPMEYGIAEDMLTREFVEKEYAKAVEENGGTFDNTLIPKVLGIVCHEFVRDNIMIIIKKYRRPTIDFRALYKEIEIRSKVILGWA